MYDAPTSATLADIDARLRAVRSRQVVDEARRLGRRVPLPGSIIEFAGRVGNDLVAAMLIAIAVGVGIDGAFGTWPFGILGMFLLGASAAVRNVYKTADKMADCEAAEQDQKINRRN